MRSVVLALAYNDGWQGGIAMGREKRGGVGKREEGRWRGFPFIHWPTKPCHSPTGSADSQ